MHRRSFFARLAAAAFAAVAANAGCGDDGGGDSTPDASPVGDGGTPDCELFGTAIGISANHGDPHTLVIPKEDVVAREERTYETEGSDHTHMVTVTSMHFQMLADGTEVTITSSTDSMHEHFITVRCARG